MGDDYDAVHVRNTDYRTDYMALFKKIFPEVQRRKLLICSDDRQCITVAEKFFVDSDVTTVTAIPDTGGKPLHLMTTNTAENNTMMLTDLFALAGAKRLFFSSTTMERPLSSGFSRLAEGLRLRPDIRARLFGGSVREAAAGAPEISGAGDI